MKKFEIADFMNRITVFNYTALSQDGTKLAYISNITGNPQVWVGEISKGANKLLYPKPITNSKDKSPHVMSPALQWIGNDKLAMLMDRHGDEQTYIEILNFKTGETIDLSHKGGKEQLEFVSKDQKFIGFTSTRANNEVHSLYLYDITLNQSKLVHQPQGKAASWSGVYAGKVYYFTESSANTETALKSININSKVVSDVFSVPNTITKPIAILRKNRLLVVTNFEREFESLAVLDLKTKKLSFLAKDLWDVELACLSSDKKNLFVTKNVAGRSVLEQYKLPSLKKVSISFKKSGVISGLDYSKKTNSLVLGFTSPTEPRNFYRLDLKSKKIDRLTDNWVSRIPESILVSPESIFYNSNGKKIHSWLFLPNGAKKNQSCPVIVWPHGGPQVQERGVNRMFFQYFLYQGFAIWAPNHRGSTGYGKSFTKEIEGNWGTADFPDMVNGIQWLKDSKWIDPKRIAIMGGSYGGYMTLRSITKLSNTFKAAVNIFGVSNMLSFLSSVPQDWKIFMDTMVGDPVRDYQKLFDQSPINFLENVDCPLLVIQGAKDPRVVKAESDQVVNKLKSLSKEVEYLVFEDEGHGFLKSENELKSYELVAQFLQKHV